MEKVVSSITLFGKGTDYIVGIVQQSLHIIPIGVIAGKLDKFTTKPPSFGTTIREAGVCVLNIHEGSV